MPQLLLYRYDVRSPFLMLTHRNGRALPRRYSGRREIAFARSWLLRELENRRLRYVSRIEEMETVFDASAVMVFGYFPSVDMDMLSTFRELAKNFPDALFVYSSEADIGEHLGLHSDTVVCF